MRSILSYVAETRAETAETKQILRTVEIKYLRTIEGVMLTDQMRSCNIGAECNVEDVVRWARTRRRNWGDYVDRIVDYKCAN